MAITLPQLLDARDARRDMQQSLLRSYPGKAIVVLTVNIPGPVKRTGRSVAAGREGVKAILERLPSAPLHIEERDLPTGFEAFIIASIPPAEAKRICIAIETGHPLGRLLDIDVIGPDGVPLSRTDFGGEPRKCLICGEDARICMRAGTHTVAELLEVVNNICDGYFQRT